MSAKIIPWYTPVHYDPLFDKWVRSRPIKPAWVVWGTNGKLISCHRSRNEAIAVTYRDPKAAYVEEM